METTWIYDDKWSTSQTADDWYLFGNPIGYRKGRFYPPNISHTCDGVVPPDGYRGIEDDKCNCCGTPLPEHMKTIALLLGWE